MPSSLSNVTKVKSQESSSGTTELKLFGKDSMGYTQMTEMELPAIDTLEQARTQIMTAGRPSNFENTMMMATTFWQPYAMMDFIRREVSIVATIISRSVIEIFRYGIDWKPKFIKKCTTCGTEFQEAVHTCPVCGNRTLVEPEERQKDYFVRPNGRSFLDEANDSGQSLKAVLQSYGESEYQNNQGYILCVTGDVLNTDDNSIEKSYPLEFVTIDPKYVRKLLDESAVPGRMYGFVGNDRHTMLNLDAYPLQQTENGEPVYPAYYQIGYSFGGTAEYWLYTKEEVYCDNWFSQSQTYGVPPWMDIEDDIFTYHFIEKHQLKRWQYGYVRGLLVFPGFNRQSMEDLAKSVKQVLAKNDNSIPMVALPPAIPGAGEQKVQFVSLTNDTASDMITYKNDIRDRLCARVGVPNVVVTDTENSGGLNNESQQITVFDRYLMDKYDNVDRILNTFILGWFPKITDWELCVTRPPKMNTELKEKMDWVQYAKGMRDLGFKITGQKNGEFEFSDEPVQDKTQSNNQGMGGGFPSFR